MRHERTTILSGVGQARSHKGNKYCSGICWKRYQDGSSERKTQECIRLYQALKSGSMLIKEFSSRVFLGGKAAPRLKVTRDDGSHF